MVVDVRDDNRRVTCRKILGWRAYTTLSARVRHILSFRCLHHPGVQAPFDYSTVTQTGAVPGPMRPIFRAAVSERSMSYPAT
jgi:hypothetical protein